MRIILLTLILLTGCVKHKKLEKPFIVIGKWTEIGINDRTLYMVRYQDKNGERSTFSELKDKYSIGDTLK